MTPHSEYLVGILEHLGAPLMQAVTRAAPENASTEDVAKTVAELLSASVKLSIEISKIAQFNVPGNDAHDDSLRAALAALAGPLVAEHYRRTVSVPDDKDLQKIISGLGAVLSFSENFGEENEAVKKLDSTQAQTELSKQDENEIAGQLQTLHAWTPVLNAVARFSFGQTPVKLASEIGAELVKRRDVLFKTLSTGENADKQEAQKRALLQTLGHLYAACHIREVERLDKAGSVGQKDGKAPSLAPVWEDFDTRMAMLEALGTGFAGQTVKAAPVAVEKAPETSAQPVAEVASAAPPQVPTQDTSAVSPENTLPAEPATAPPPPPPPASSDAANPMGFFAAPKAEDSESTPQAENAPAPAPVEAVPPPPAAPPPPPVQDAPPQQTPPQEVPATAPVESGDTNNSDSKGDEDKSAGGNPANPMSFFKAPPQEDE